MAERRKPAERGLFDEADSDRSQRARGQPDQSGRRGQGMRAENSIHPVKGRARSGASEAVARPAPAADAQSPSHAAAGVADPARERPAATPGPAAEDDVPVPEHVRQRFVQVGRKYYFPDGERAFTDRGRRLTTRSENTQVIASLVAIAQAREWSQISVRGTHRFRKEAWFAANLAGLKVEGYRPNEFERARLVRTLAQRDLPDAEPASDESRTSAAASAADGRDAASAARHARHGLLSGTLVDHGRANYRHDPHEPMSYFVKLDTSRGERLIWGVDLERAIKQSLTKPKTGDAVGLRAVRADPVTVKAAQRDARGEEIGEEAIQVYRNRWIIEKREFFDSRAAAAQTLLDTRITPKQGTQAHPELAGTYLQMQAATLAARRFRDPQDRERFISHVRSALAESVARGEPLPPLRLRERPVTVPTRRARDRGEREPAAVRG
ncbi:MAG TPA: LPD7 domain-containing protein [Steroidobacteraceae bacterium]|jgi:putative DNA primase/helicase|nr:LPD7 domain-containing protein [Steroidobacteraceae bacterium]